MMNRTNYWWLWVIIYDHTKVNFVILNTFLTVTVAAVFRQTAMAWQSMEKDVTLKVVHNTKVCNNTT